MLSTPIINPPQSAILGMHNIIERPVAVKWQSRNQTNDVFSRFLMTTELLMVENL